MFVEKCTRQTLIDWIRLRQALWPQATEEQHRREAVAMLDRRRDAVAYVVRAENRETIGFAEATLRRDPVNGCETLPVAFLEGIYVRRGWRRRGAARLLCDAVETWAARHGCTELASDAGLRNRTSQRMHKALGFEETERVVFYRMVLRRD